MGTTGNIKQTVHNTSHGYWWMNEKNIPSI
jgi:hypothetical protein